jgi:restriction endonuclease S subunit
MIRCSKKSLTDIPKEWTKSQIKDVTLLMRAGGNLGLTKIKDYQKKGFPAYSAAGQDGFVPIFEFAQPGVVVSAIGARCGKCFYATDKWTTLANTQAILADESKMLNRFLWYLINDESYWHRSGTAQPFIKPSDIQNAWIPVPPPTEQVQIVNRLDFLLQSINRHREAIKEVDLLYRGLLQKLQNGELHVFDQKSRMQDVSKLRMGEILISKNLTGDGIPVFSADTGRKPWGYTSNSKNVFERGTIILSARGSIGYPRLPDFDKYISTQTTIAIRPKPEFLVPKFLHVWLQTIDYKILTSTQAVPMLTVADMNDVFVPRIDKTEQKKIAALFASLTKIKEKHQQCIETLEDVFSSCRLDLLYGTIRL